MTRAHFALLLPLCFGAASAWADPLHTPACRQAVAQLEQEEARQDTKAAQVSKGLAQARAQVAKVCLQAEADSVPPAARNMPAPAGRLAQPPLSVAPVSPAVAPSQRSAPPPAVAPVPSRPLTTVTTCDANGCWASDGTRLQRIGQQLLGPRGVCSTAGAVLNCP